MDLTTVYDCTGTALAGFGGPQKTQMAGYVTGSGGVPWTVAQLAAHPGVVRIDQSPVNTAADETADVYDLENQAGTLDGVVDWVRGAWTSFNAGTRPGQRKPTVYCSQSTETPLANRLIAGGIIGGVNLWRAQPMDGAAATALLRRSGGPFPIIGVQYEFHPTFDVSLVSTAWLNDVSKDPAIHRPGPGTQAGWKYCSKCTGLFWGPQEAVSHCPAGGAHNGSQSHTYTLPFSV